MTAAGILRSILASPVAACDLPQQKAHCTRHANWLPCGSASAEIAQQAVPPGEASLIELSADGCLLGCIKPKINPKIGPMLRERLLGRINPNDLELSRPRPAHPPCLQMAIETPTTYCWLVGNREIRYSTLYPAMHTL